LNIYVKLPPQLDTYLFHVFTILISCFPGIMWGRSADGGSEMTGGKADGELEAIMTIYSALEPLDDDARTRVINYILARLDIATEKEPDGDVGEVSSDQESALKKEQSQAPKYGSFADLFDATQPNSNSEKALVAGYWTQVCQGQEDFDGQSANRELKHLGEQIANITVAFNQLREQKPALVIQLKKSGKSQQARKTYKVTVAGIKAVEAMIGK
jgi:hypothetical protein